MKTYRVDHHATRSSDNSAFSEPASLFHPFKSLTEEADKKCISEENDYSENPIEQDTLKSKVNEYCYIPGSLMVFQPEIQMKSENLTPELPKTLPPRKSAANLETIFVSESVNEYEVPSKIVSPNEYTICDEDLFVELNDVYEYQIPSNIPTLKKNSNLIL